MPLHYSGRGAEYLDLRQVLRAVYRREFTHILESAPSTQLGHENKYGQDYTGERHTHGKILNHDSRPQQRYSLIHRNTP